MHDLSVPEACYALGPRVSVCHPVHKGELLLPTLPVSWRLAQQPAAWHLVPHTVTLWFPVYL